MNFLKRLRNHEMKRRDYGWIVEIAFLRLARSLLLCWGGVGSLQMILNFRETTFRKHFRSRAERHNQNKHKKHTKKKKKNELAAVAAGRVEIAELWGVGITMILCLSLAEVRLTRSSPRKSLPRERSRWLQQSQSPKRACRA